MRTVLLTLFIAISLSSLEARAQRQTANDGNQYVLRTYEVGDLILSINDRPYSESLPKPAGVGRFPAGGDQFSARDQKVSTRIFFAQRGGGFGGGGGGFGGGGYGGGGFGIPGAVPSNAANIASVTMDRLIDAIVTAVAHDSWSENGGGDGRIVPVGAALVVWQTAPVHQQIEGLLDSLREGSGRRRTLRIDARWLLLNSDELDQLASGEESRIDREALDRFTRQPSSIRGIANCFSGQLIYLVSGTRRNVVQSYIPVVGSVDDPWSEDLQLARDDDRLITLVSQQESSGANRSVGYQPLISTPNFGALLEVRPTLIQGDDRVTVDLKSTITVPGQQRDDLENTAAIASGAPAVDRIAIETQEFATTLRIPLGEPFLVGGMTYSPTAGDGQRAPDQEVNDAEKPQLYLVLEVK